MVGLGGREGNWPHHLNQWTTSSTVTSELAIKVSPSAIMFVAPVTKPLSLVNVSTIALKFHISYTHSTINSSAKVP